MLTMKMTPYHSGTSSALTPGRPSNPVHGRLFMIGRKIGTVSSRMPIQSRNMPSTNRISIINIRMP